MSDLIARLRSFPQFYKLPADVKWMRGADGAEEVTQEAADRIESLERELAELRAQQPPREPTPEMIAAGVREWLDGSPGLSSPEAMVRRVFAAMYDRAK